MESVGAQGLRAYTDVTGVHSIQSLLFHGDVESLHAENSIIYAKHQLPGQSEVIAQMKYGQVEEGHFKDGVI